MSETEETKAKDSNGLPPPSAVFMDLASRPKQKEVKMPKRNGSKEARMPYKPGIANALIRTMKRKALTSQFDFPRNFKPSDDIFGSGTGEDERPSIIDLYAICNTRMGVVWCGTQVVSSDSMRNWHVFVDPDTQKEVRNPTTKSALNWAVETDLRNQSQQWLRWTLGLGTGWLVKYWTKDDLKNMKDEPPLSKPPKRFRAFSPLYMQPINTDKSNELNYQEDVWQFSGGEINQVYNIHKDRVDVLSIYKEEGHWRGLSICEPVWLALMGYFQAFIYITKGLRTWGDAVPAMFTGDGIPEEGEISSMLDVMDEYAMNYKWALGKDDRLEFIQTNIGKGIREAMEQYKEEISSAWRIPLNQLFGRSVGGGLAGAGALVSKEDYLQEISNKQMAMSDNIKKIYIDAGWKVESYDLLWNLAVKKTDEQRMREEGMEIQNKILTEQWKQAKAQTQLLKMQVEQAHWQALLPEQGEEGEGGEGEGGKEEGGPTEIGEEDQMEIAELTDFQKRSLMAKKKFWNSIHIENHIQFPYGDKRY